MGKIYFQGTYGAYSHIASQSIDPKAEIIPCKTFDECFLSASKDVNAKKPRIRRRSSYTSKSSDLQSISAKGTEPAQQLPILLLVPKLDWVIITPMVPLWASWI